MLGEIARRAVITNAVSQQLTAHLGLASDVEQQQLTTAAMLTARARALPANSSFSLHTASNSGP